MVPCGPDAALSRPTRPRCAVRRSGFAHYARMPSGSVRAPTWLPDRAEVSRPPGGPQLRACGRERRYAVEAPDRA
ncbi:hypothetical protein WK34_21415 [Burkholderia vietnamiensis]|nr:hypothetical protein WK34_21415 [Burkholderia vietnamiensis]